MAKEKEKDTRRTIRIASLVAGVFVVLSWGGVVGGYTWFTRSYTNRIYPGVYVANHDVSGSDFMTALALLDGYDQFLSEDGIEVSFDDTKINLTSTLASPDSDVARELFYFENNRGVIEEAYGVGRTGDLWNDMSAQFQAVTTGKKIDVSPTLTEEVLTNILAETFSEYETPAQDAILSFDEGEPMITPEEAGEVFDWESVKWIVDDQLHNLDQSPIALELVLDKPTIKASYIESELDTIKEVLSRAPFTLEHEGVTWEVTKEDLEGMVTVALIPLTKGEAGENIRIALDPDAAELFFADIKDEVDQPVKEGRFKIEDGVVSQFEEPQDGLVVNVEETTAALEAALLAKSKGPVQLVVVVDEPKINVDNIEALGIKELLGTGTSNMAGSPVNRTFNIDKAIADLNGLLIAPGETFSLLTALGDIDGASGYLPELVIKGDRTIPEYGGGLCQIGTTTFRAAMNAGMEITERRNHSYAVSYYDWNGKPGVDATIYEPAPDFRWTNDTEHYILMQTRREGSDLFFDFWGTSDGRSGSYTTPVNFNYRSPGPTKEIVDPNMAPGTRRCVETAHTGLDATFTYNIERADGTVDEEEFFSRYRAWPAVCYVGPDAPEEEPPAEEPPAEEPAPDPEPTPDPEPEPEPEPEPKKDEKKKSE